MSIERIGELTALGRQVLASEMDGAVDRARLEEFHREAKGLVEAIYPGSQRARVFEEAPGAAQVRRGLTVLEEIRAEIEYAGSFGH